MVNYTIHQRVNLQSPDDPRKYYAIAKAAGVVDLRSLAKRITRESTISMMDTMAVLEGLIQVVPDMLMDGNIVKLGEFGNFRLGVSSEGAENPDEFNNSLIKKTNLLFRPGSEFSDQLKKVKFSRINSTSTSS
jgi:predicted histone-like DNA-binding protein